MVGAEIRDHVSTFSSVTNCQSFPAKVPVSYRSLRVLTPRLGVFQLERERLTGRLVIGPAQYLYNVFRTSAEHPLPQCTDKPSKASRNRVANLSLPETK